MYVIIFNEFFYKTIFIISPLGFVLRLPMKVLVFINIYHIDQRDLQYVHKTRFAFV